MNRYVVSFILKLIEKNIFNWDSGCQIQRKLPEDMKIKSYVKRKKIVIKVCVHANKQHKISMSAIINK